MEIGTSRIEAAVSNLRRWIWAGYIITATALLTNIIELFCHPSHSAVPFGINILAAVAMVLLRPLQQQYKIARWLWFVGSWFFILALFFLSKVVVAWAHQFGWTFKFLELIDVVFLVFTVSFTGFLLGPDLRMFFSLTGRGLIRRMFTGLYLIVTCAWVLLILLFIHLTPGNTPDAQATADFGFQVPRLGFTSGPMQTLMVQGTKAWMQVMKVFYGRGLDLNLPEWGTFAGRSPAIESRGPHVFLFEDNWTSIGLFVSPEDREMSFDEMIQQIAATVNTETVPPGATGDQNTLFKALFMDGPEFKVVKHLQASGQRQFMWMDHPISGENLLGLGSYLGAAVRIRLLQKHRVIFVVGMVGRGNDRSGDINADSVDDFLAQLMSDNPSLHQ